MPYELVKTDKLYYPDKPDKLNKPGKPNWLEKVKAVPLHTPWRECASMIIGTILYECRPFLHFSYCRFEEKAVYADYISQVDGSRQTISTTLSTFRRYILTSRVFDHQDWSSLYNCWVSRPGMASRSRTLFKRGVYVKSDSAPLTRLS